MAGRNDLAFLREMLIEAAYWRSGESSPDAETALSRPDLCFLLEDWGRPGDGGIVALRDAPVGAAWYRLWTLREHSYGFVDEATPELAIGVVEQERGRGVGSAMLGALADLARDRGIARLSLSVEDDNPAARLYARQGFTAWAREANATTMVLAL